MKLILLTCSQDGASTSKMAVAATYRSNGPTRKMRHLCLYVYGVDSLGLQRKLHVT